MTSRRRPTQLRAQQTVEAILDAVVRILKREGPAAVTTNRVAEVAGVSIGSLYQYFPNKHSIFSALHTRHIAEVDRVIQSAIIDNASGSLRRLVQALVDAMIHAHSADPELFELLAAQIPHRAGGTQDFASRLHGAFRLALAARSSDLRPDLDIAAAAFMVSQMVDAFCHGAVLSRPPEITLEAAREESVRAILVYLEPGPAIDRDRGPLPPVLRPWDS